MWKISSFQPETTSASLWPCQHAATNGWWCLLFIKKGSNRLFSQPSSLHHQCYGSGNSWKIHSFSKKRNLIWTMCVGPLRPRKKTRKTKLCPILDGSTSWWKPFLVALYMRLCAFRLITLGASSMTDLELEVWSAKIVFVWILQHDSRKPVPVGSATATWSLTCFQIPIRSSFYSVLG